MEKMDEEKKVVKKKATKKKTISKKETNPDNLIVNTTGEKRVLTFSLVEMIVIVIIVSIVVSAFTGLLVFRNHRYFSNITTTSNNKVENEELKEFIELYNDLKEKYVEDVDGEKLIEAATKGMFDYLDIYTSYIDQETTVDVQDRLNGEYKGIGVEITANNDGFVEIVTVFPNTPAEEVGLKSGDLIISINGESMIGKTASDVANTIKGNSNVKFITLIYRRNGKDLSAKIDISKVIIPSVESKMLEGNIGYIKLSTFSNTTYDQVKAALEELEGKGMKSLIIDVRDNSGGYLNSAQDISELFLKKGKVIYQLKYKNGNIDKIASTSNTNRDYKVVVLVNEFSASASEILALALKESYGATIVGKRTYGKGTVQDTDILSNGSMIKFTSAYWLSPKGNSINNVGIEPDVEVNSTETGDAQLEKAKEVIK